MKKLIAMIFVVGAGSMLCSPAAQAIEDDIVVLPECSFKLSVETSASKSTLWRLWSDVENWKKFDTLLKYSYLKNGAKFKQGSVGYLKARGAPRTKFELIEVVESVSFVERLKLPFFQSIELRRYFEVNENGRTVFTHEVTFRGGLRFVMYGLLSRTFKRELYKVMGNLKEVAEREERQENPMGQRKWDQITPAPLIFPVIPIRRLRPWLAIRSEYQAQDFDQKS